MTTLGLPTAMFLVFVATVLAGSLGAIHYVVFHVIMGRPFAEIPPPVVREADGSMRADKGPAGRTAEIRAPRDEGPAGNPEARGLHGEEGLASDGGGEDPRG